MGDALYRRNGVTVTPTLVEIGRTTYAVASIGSVKVEPVRRPGLFVLAVVLMAATFLAVLVALANAGRNPDIAKGFGFAAAVCGLLVWSITRVKGTYALVLATASGDRQALTSENQGELGGIRHAIESAMAAAREVRPAADMRRMAEEVAEKTCPRCAETVKAAAIVCRFCGHDFAALPVE